MFVHEILDRACGVYPDAEAIRDASGSWTYRELGAASHACAGWLAAHGAGPGDRLLVQAVSDRRLAALLYGCSRAGVVCVPVSASTRPYQLSHMLADADPALVIWSDGPPWTAGKPVWMLDQVWSALPAAAVRPAKPGREAIFFYTSGSTAQPRAVVCPHSQVVFAAHAIARRLGYQRGDVVYCRLPLSFDYGLYQVLLCAIGGATLVLADGSTDVRLAAEVRRHGATIVPVVPALAGMLVRLAARGARTSGVRLFTNTGDALPAPLIAGLREQFPGAGVQLMFGLTECKRVSIADVDADRRYPGSVGRPLDGTEVAIVDEAGHELPPGVAGEIVVSGPHVMAGYWRAPELTRRFFRTDPVTGRAVLFTGDIGSAGSDGQLYLHGRRDQIFKSRGMRTSVAEIEAAALDIPGVTEAAVVPPAGQRDAFLYVVTELTVEKVLLELTGRLDPAKIPGTCRHVPHIPQGPTGKVDRTAVARWAEAC